MNGKTLAIGLVAIGVPAGLFYFLRPRPEAAKGKILSYSLSKGGVMVSERVRAEIEEILAAPLALVTVPLGGRVRASIKWRNVGGDGARDIIAIYGKYQSYGMVTSFYGVVQGVSLAAGGEITTQVDVVCTQAGMWDALIGVGKWDGSSFVADDQAIAQGTLEVKAAASVKGQIVSYNLSPL